MTIYKIELLIVDHDRIGADEIKSVLENQRYPNHCIYPTVMGVHSREVEWSDDHPLNGHDREKAYDELFPSSAAGRQE